MSNNVPTIAVAATDGPFVADHLARASRFLLYSINDGNVVFASTVARDADACGSHRSFTDLLAGCDAVMCGGVGQGAVDALAAAGTRTIVLARPYTIDDALTAYVSGALEVSDARVCLCGPGH
jgi:predicted Fe-Mo cluster-binding NifX family protein